MLTWATLLDGYPIYQRAFETHTTLVSDVFSSGAVVQLYLDILDNSFNIFRFVFQGFAAAFLLVLFLAFWYLVLGSALRRIGKI
jgi:hypothetical protein